MRINMYIPCGGYPFNFKDGESIMSEEKEVHGKFRFDQDSKRFHRFQIETDVGIVGTIYVPKNKESMPKKITLEYAAKT